MYNILNKLRSAKPSDSVWKRKSATTLYNKEEQLKALKNNRGLKTIKGKQSLGRKNIVTLREEDGTLIEDRDRLIRKCEEFYIKLYRTRRPQDQPFTDVHYKETGQPPPILPFEVRDAVKRLKRDKAPGEDNITTGTLQEEGRNQLQDVHEAVQQMHCGWQSSQQLEECIGNHPPQEGRHSWYQEL